MRVKIVRTVAAALVQQACLPVAPQGPPPLPGADAATAAIAVKKNYILWRNIFRTVSQLLCRSMPLL